MISRASGNASSHLQRSKSATCVQDRRKHPLIAEPQDPRIARAHALIAAHAAMNQHQTTHPSMTVVDHAKFSRQHARPRATPSSRLGNPEHQRHQLQIRSEPADTAMETELGRSAQTSTSYKDAIILAAQDGDDPAFSPSTFFHRKLRRPTSGTSPGAQRSSHTCSSPSASLRPVRTLRVTASSKSLQRPSMKVRLKRSLNLLRTSHPPSGVPIQFQPELTCRPESIALARAHFMQSEMLSSQGFDSAQLMQPREKRSHKFLRRSFRARPLLVREGIHDINAAHVLRTIGGAKPALVSFRDRIKKSLRLSSLRNRDLPAQQIDATGDGLEKLEPENSSYKGWDDYYDSEDEVEAARRTSIYEPYQPIFATANDATKSERQNSLASDGTLVTNSKSRVTSWTNSTLSSACQNSLLEQKRLSVIREDGGPHQPSSSVGRHIGGLSNFQQPLNLGSETHIDSQRIYSALIKRIEQEQANMAQSEVDFSNAHDMEVTHDPGSIGTTIRCISEQTDVQPLVNLSCSSSQHWSPDHEPNSSQKLDTHAPTLETSAECGKNIRTINDHEPRFYPFSSTQKPTTPSPFRKLLMEKRRRQVTRTKSQSIRGAPSNRSRHGNFRSSASLNGSVSVYSADSGADENLHFAGHHGEFQPPVLNHDEILNNDRAASVLRSDEEDPAADYHKHHCTTLKAVASTAEKVVWRDWISQQMSSITRTGSRLTRQHREMTRHSSGDETVGTIHTATGLESASSSGVPNQQLLKLPNGGLPGTTGIFRTTIVRTADNDQEIGESHLHEHAPGHGAISYYATTNSQITGGMAQQTELSKPGNLRNTPYSVSKRLRLKKQKSLPANRTNAWKENQRPPELQHQSVNTFGQGRRFGSDHSVNTDLTPSIVRMAVARPADEISTSAESPSIYEESPTLRTSNALSARLSRPFNMDVPELNRPFDSMYLGKITPTSRRKNQSDRLSVGCNIDTPRHRKTYGELRKHISNHLREGDSVNAVVTAVPLMNSSQALTRSISLADIASSGKRAVSKLLKGHRAIREHVVKHSTTSPSESPVFL